MLSEIHALMYKKQARDEIVSVIDATCDVAYKTTREPALMTVVLDAKYKE